MWLYRYLIPSHPAAALYAHMAQEGGQGSLSWGVEQMSRLRISGSSSESLPP